MTTTFKLKGSYEHEDVYAPVDVSGAYDAEVQPGKNTAATTGTVAVANTVTYQNNAYDDEFGRNWDMRGGV